MKVVINGDLGQIDQREMSYDEATGFIRLIKEVDTVNFNNRTFKPVEIYLELSDSMAIIEEVKIELEEQGYGN